MQLQWEAKIGPASIIGALGILIQAGVVVWAISAFKTNVDNHFVQVDGKFTEQTNHIETIAQGSNKRFETVHVALAAAQNGQAAAAERMGKIETAVSFIKDQVQQLVSKVDGH